MPKETTNLTEYSPFEPSVLGEYIQQLHKEGRKNFVTLLVGAGFSRSAGIPSAAEIVKELRGQKDHPLLRNAGPPQTGVSEYAFLMDKLGSPKERAKWIKKFVDRGRDENGELRINWSHLLLAAMVDKGLVNRILTTNFDPLIVEALALTGQSIRTFDLSTTGHYHPGTFDPGSSIYLHGQMHSLFLANVKGEMDQVKQLYPGVLQEAVQDSLLIVVGYSGECDPVLESLRELPSFPFGLWWSHYSSTSRQPCDDVEKLFIKHCNACHLASGDDADTFMRKLVFDGLKLDLPDIVLSPFRAADSMLSRITPFPTKDYQGGKTDPVQSARALLQKAQEASEIKLTDATAASKATVPQKAVDTKTSLAELSEIVAIQMAALLDNKSKVKEFSKVVSPDPKLPISRALGSAYCRLASSSMAAERYDEAARLLETAEKYGVTDDWTEWLPTLIGIALTEQAKLKGNTPEADKLFERAGQKYVEAVRIKPDMHAALNNWGLALELQAAMKGNTLEADKLFEQAGQKFTEAIRIKPDHKTFYNWGLALEQQAAMKGNTPEADKLFEQANQKFTEAIRIKPDHGAFNNWGAALGQQAKLKGNTPEADKLFERAGQKYAEAVRIKPDMHEAFYNWGTALTEQAKLKGNIPQAGKLFERACQKYAEAVRIKPDHEAFFNWGTALWQQAKFKGNTPEADKLFEQVGQKYAEAIRIKPDMHEAFSSWGAALAAQAKLKGSTTEADKLFEQASQKYAEAVRIKPDEETTHFNLACIAALKGDAVNCCSHLNNWKKYHPNPQKKKLDTDTDFDRVRDKPEFQQVRNTLPD